MARKGLARLFIASWWLSETSESFVLLRDTSASSSIRAPSSVPSSRRHSDRACFRDPNNCRSWFHEASASRRTGVARRASARDTTSPDDAATTTRTKPAVTKKKRTARVRPKSAAPSNKRLGKESFSSSDSRSSASSTTTTWRVYGVEVHPDDLACKAGGRSNTDAIPAAGSEPLHPAVLEALYRRILRLPRRSGTDDENANSSNRNATGDRLDEGVVRDVRVVRHSVDARLNQRRRDGATGPRHVYVLDVTIDEQKNRAAEPSARLRLVQQPGRIERLDEEHIAAQVALPSRQRPQMNALSSLSDAPATDPAQKPVVVIVGGGPAGLFCALSLARSGNVRPVVLERGQPVESRGRDIGALMHRSRMNPESNYAFGEGGAGTWSDGKLTTRIGRNSGSVRHVLETLVQYGAPASILVEGAPHLGTDNLVRLLRNMRQDLRRLGGEVRFGHRVTGLVIEEGRATGVDYVSTPAPERHVAWIENLKPKVNQGTNGTAPNHGRILGDAVVLATGHSARDVYEQLHQAGVQLEAKGFAVGFRVEHPQRIINKIQYGTEWGRTVVTGKTTTDNANEAYLQAMEPETAPDALKQHSGTLPVPSYRLATDKAFDGERNRGVYSFCMCPGGQIVPASTDPNEVCVNGMSFSRRDSQWANSALVVTVLPDDDVLDPYRQAHGVLAGIAFQRDMERKAARLGGGNLTVPVQRLTDFVQQKASTSAPSTSYRLGIKPSACHEIYPPSLTASLRCALVEHFDKVMPGFLCDDGLLHAVETRTSSPVRISRDDETKQAIGVDGLFPSGEGAGFAGGIVSAAVDGLVVADAVERRMGIQPLNPSKSITDKISSYY